MTYFKNSWFPRSMVSKCSTLEEFFDPKKQLCTILALYKALLQGLPAALGVRINRILRIPMEVGVWGRAACHQY